MRKTYWQGFFDGQRSMAIAYAKHLSKHEKNRFNKSISKSNRTLESFTRADTRVGKMENDNDSSRKGQT